jgi:hypothetical protein
MIQQNTFYSQQNTDMKKSYDKIHKESTVLRLKIIHYTFGLYIKQVKMNR